MALLAGFGLVAGAWSLYEAYVRREVEAALAETAHELRVQLSHRGISVGFPDRVRIHGLSLSGLERDFRVQLSQLEVREASRLDRSDPHTRLHLPEQTVRMSAAGRQYEAKVSGRADLAPAAGDGQPTVLRDAYLELHGLRGRADDSAELASRIQLRLASEGALAQRGLRGRVYAVGQAAERPLALVGAGAALRWLFPNALGSPFRARGELQLADGSLALERIQASAGGIEVRGALRIDDAVSGALLIETRTRNVGVAFDDGAARPELAPAQGWLDRQLGPAGLVAARAQRAPSQPHIQGEGT